MTETYDSKCWDLAAHFLEGDPDIAHLATTDRIEQLAADIQWLVEAWIAGELANYEPSETSDAWQ